MQLRCFIWQHMCKDRYESGAVWVKWAAGPNLLLSYLGFDHCAES